MPASVVLPGGKVERVGGNGFGSLNELELTGVLPQVNLGAEL